MELVKQYVLHARRRQTHAVAWIVTPRTKEPSKQDDRRLLPNNSTTCRIEMREPSPNRPLDCGLDVDVLWTQGDLRP